MDGDSMSQTYQAEEWVQFLTADKLSNKDVGGLHELTTLCGGDFERHVNGLDVSGFDDNNDHITYLVYQEWSGGGVGFWCTALDFHEPTKTILESFGRKVNNGSLCKRIYELLLKVDYQISSAMPED
jgi:hypothetical protein